MLIKKNLTYFAVRTMSNKYKVFLFLRPSDKIMKTGGLNILKK